MGKRKYELGTSLYRRQPLPIVLVKSKSVMAITLVVVGGFSIWYGIQSSLFGPTVTNEGIARRDSRSEGRERVSVYVKNSDAYRRYRLYVKHAHTTDDYDNIKTGGQTGRMLQGSSDEQLSVPDDNTPDTIITSNNDIATEPAAATAAGASGQSGTDASGRSAQATTAIPVASAGLAEPLSVVLPSVPTIVAAVPTTADLNNPVKKDVAMQLVSSAENSSLDWKAQYTYLEDIEDGRGYTGGIVGFCSGTGDMLDLVRYYTKLKPGNPLAGYLPALEKVNGSDSHSGLGSGFEAAWKTAAKDPAFQQAQNDERDRVYFNPAVSQAKSDGLRALGQFVYYDAIVMHGPGNDSDSFGGIRATALKKAKTPAQGGDEATYLNAFLDARAAAMKTEDAHDDVSRVEAQQRLFVKAGNFNLNMPLSWKSYGEPFSIQ